MSSSDRADLPMAPRALLLSVLAAAATAFVLAVTVVLPAELGIDPLGTGAWLGLSRTPGERKLTVRDVTGGNERYREVKLPAAGEPLPLPNPAVHQDEATAPAVREIRITIPPEKGTEFKLVMDAAKTVVYSWQVEGGEVYADFHGHDPQVGDSQFVRYKEQQQGTHSHGSLVAPFSGEHGWYWLNIGGQPVTVKLRISGYWRDLRDHGISGN